ncbi:MAG: hypothetical protein GY810_12010 [Aureispira sp.]|nr:hypothetical protein [Aureispira sp.]
MMNTYNYNPKNSLRTVFFSAILLCCNLFLFAQSKERVMTSSAPTEIEVAEKGFIFPEIENYTGTYQFIFSKRRNISIPKVLLKHIEENRKEDEDVTIKVASFCSILILSKQKIEAEDFIPFETPYQIQ